MINSLRHKQVQEARKEKKEIKTDSPTIMANGWNVNF